LTESQLRYELDSKTAQVIKVIAPTQLTYQGVNGIYDVDITRNVVTQEEYDSLPRLDLSDENLNAIRNKANCIILDLQDNKITNLFYVQDLILGFTQNVDVLENAIKYSIFRQFPLSTSIDIDPIKQRKIRVQYYRLRDSDLSVQRQSNNGMVQSTIGYTQKASVVDVGSYMNALTTLSSRMGNQEKTITLAFDNDQTPYEIGDYDSDGFVITEAKYTLRPNDIFAEYNLSLNYANTNSDYAVRYEISPFTVTGKKLMTNVIDEQYVIASDVELASNDTKMTSRGLSSLFSLLSRVARQRIEYGVYKQTNQIFPYTQAIHMPVAEEYGSSTLAFNVHFERPIIAGKRVYTEQATQFLDPILYTANIDEEYVLENFELYLSNGADITDDGSYPIIEETNDVITNALTLNEQMPIDLGLNDSLSYTFAIHGVTNNELKVGFGNGFFKYNGLWYDSTPTLTLYKSTYPYSIADKTIRDVDTPVINGNYTFNSSRRRLNVSGSESFNYWALVYQGDIVVWGNNTKEVWFRIVREIEPNYDPITLITDSYFEIIPTTVLFEPLVQSVTYIEQEVLETVTPSVLFDIAIQSVTFITEAYIIDEPTTVIMDVIIGDFTILSRSIVLNEPTTILKTETITNFTYVEDSITLVEPTTILFTPSVQNANTIQDTTLLTITPTVLFTPQIQNATVLTDSIIVNEPTTIINDNQVITETNITQEILLTSSTTILNTSTITNVVWDFDYLGTATQPFDFSYTLAVEGADAGACPSASQVDTWLNANYDVYNFSVGDIIRVQTVVVDSNGFPVASCNSHYFEVVVV
jgi:hypothetical protein